jgi:hypothetical protein
MVNLRSSYGPLLVGYSHFRMKGVAELSYDGQCKYDASYDPCSGRLEGKLQKPRNGEFHFVLK